MLKSDCKMVIADRRNIY